MQPKLTLLGHGERASAKTVAERESALASGEQLVLSREENTNLREEAPELREKALYARKEVESEKAELRANTHTQLREANEHLVIATIKSETMAEAADLATARMYHIAQHDFLTDLPNRSLLIDRLWQAIALAQRRGKKVALMYEDLDHFKHINDSLGHDIGDHLLQAAAKRLRACVRNSDSVSRQGWR